MQVAPEIKVVINSCARFVLKSVPPLLKSLERAGVPASSIIVVVGESPAAESSTMAAGVEVRAVRYANIDNNIFMWVAFDSSVDDLGAASWFVCLHDTCQVEPDFWQKVKAHVSLRDSNAAICGASLRTFPSMSMGLYRTSAVRGQHVRDALTPLVNFSTDVEKLMSIKKGIRYTEDYVFRIMRAKGKIDALHGEPDWGKDPFFYLDGSSKRYVETHPGLGVIKYKANNTNGWFLEL